MKVQIGEIEFDALTTVAAADRFLAGDVVRAVRWGLLNDPAKGRAIVSASRKLLTLSWCEPRPDPEATVLPPVVQEVAAMLAADLAAKPGLFSDATGNSNVKSAKAGSASVEFFAPVSGGAPLPRALWDLLIASGLLCFGTATGPAEDDGLAGPIVSGISDGCRPYEGRYADYSRDAYAARDRD